MEFHDSVEISGTRKTNDGYLVADVRVARTGIQEYLGVELDPDNSLGLRDRGVVRVYRPEEEVFAADSLKSYAYRPVTNDHPASGVNSDNWKQLSVGQTGGDVVRDGDWVRVPMVVMDSSMITAVESGKRQLSMGYSLTLDVTTGMTADGKEYDAIQRNLRMNHLAIVTSARAGPQATIGDENNGESPMTDKLQKVVVDGISIETTDQGAEVIKKLQGQLRDAATASAKKDTDHATALAAKDSDLAKKDAQIDALKAKVLDGAALDAAVAARGDLIAKANAIAPDVKTAGLSDADIRKAVVVAKCGDGMKDKSEAYIEARFDTLAEDNASTQHLRQTITGLPMNSGSADVRSMDAALNKVNDDMNAWRNAKASN